MVSFLGILINQVLPDILFKRGLNMKTCDICHKLRDKSNITRVYSFNHKSFIYICKECDTFSNRIDFRIHKKDTYYIN